MESGTVDGIIGNLFHTLPVIHMKLLRMDLGGVTVNLSRLQPAMMGVLGKESLPLSEIAE